MTKWPMVPLGSVLSKSEDQIDISPDQTYKEVTVRLWGKGVCLRREAAGGEIAAVRRFSVKPGQFILSRIDARNGALGIVPTELDGAVVSNDFPVFNADRRRILPEFLNWLSKTGGFVDLCRAASEGTTNRVRLKEDRFLQMEIPLPPLPEQQKIVEWIDAVATRIEEARHLQEEAVGETEALTHSYLNETYDRLKSQYCLSTLAEVCSTITDGAHLTPAFSEEGVKFIFVGNVSSGYFHFEGCKYVTPTYYGTVLESRRPKRGDILLSAVGATLGIPAMVNTDEAFCFQRHVAILKPLPNCISSRFLWHMLRSGIVYKKVWASITGTAQPTVPLKVIKLLPLPVPPLSVQSRVVLHLDDLQAKLETVKCRQKEGRKELTGMLPAILAQAFNRENTANRPTSFQ